MAGMEAAWWLNDQLQAWLGEKNAADTLTQSVPNNVTSEMGLALLDVADAIRPHPEVVAFLQQRRGRGFPGRAAQARGRARSARRHPGLARQVRHARRRRDRHHAAALERTPQQLVPILLGHIENFEPGAAERRFEQGRQEAPKKEQELLRAPASLARRRAEGRRDEADDRPGPDVRRLPGVSEVRHGQPLLRVQAGLDGRSRAPRAGPRASGEGRHLLPQVRGDPGRRAHEPGG